MVIVVVRGITNSRCNAVDRRPTNVIFTLLLILFVDAVTPTLANFLSVVNQNHLVLDIACGYHDYLFSLAQMNEKVSGTIFCITSAACSLKKFLNTHHSFQGHQKNS